MAVESMSIIYFLSLHIFVSSSINIWKQEERSWFFNMEGWKWTILAYFPKMKIGLTNHQSLSMPVCVSP
jgi:hypothetical protein